MLSSLKLLTILLLMSTVRSEYQKISMSQERGAACLDGSAPIIFIDEGEGENKDKFLVWMEGGGTCIRGGLNETLEECYKRSFSEYGSSTSYNDTINVDENGYLSTLPSINPTFHDWTKVIIEYCDGALHISHREAPFSYKERDLFFRGADNTVEIFRYL